MRVNFFRFFWTESWPFASANREGPGPLIPTFAPAPCPPGAIPMWGEPGTAGISVVICRRLGPQQ